MKNFLAKIPCNPLKRLDSDERIQEIQENPTLTGGALRPKGARAKKIQMDRPRDPSLAARDGINLFKMYISPPRLPKRLEAVVAKIV